MCLEYKLSEKAGLRTKANIHPFVNNPLLGVTGVTGVTGLVTFVTAQTRVIRVKKDNNLR